MAVPTAVQAQTEPAPSADVNISATSAGPIYFRTSGTGWFSTSLSPNRGGPWLPWFGGTTINSGNFSGSPAGFGAYLLFDAPIAGAGRTFRFTVSFEAPSGAADPTLYIVAFDSAVRIVGQQVRPCSRLSPGTPITTCSNSLQAAGYPGMLLPEGTAYVVAGIASTRTLQVSDYADGSSTVENPAGKVISRPVDGSVVSAPVQLQINDPSGVVRVDWFINGIIVGSDTTPADPYSFSLLGWGKGPFTATAVVVDAAFKETRTPPVQFSIL